MAIQVNLHVDATGVYNLSATAAFEAGAAYLSKFNAWGTNGFATNLADAVNRYKETPGAASIPIDMTSIPTFVQEVAWFNYSDGSNYTVNGYSAYVAVLDLSDHSSVVFQRGLMWQAVNDDPDADATTGDDDVGGAIEELGRSSDVINGIRKLRGLKESEALGRVGDITGVVSMVNNGYQAYKEWNTNRWQAILHGTEALGQLAIWIIPGGEEAEMLFNLGTTAVDVGMDYYNHSNGRR